VIRYSELRVKRCGLAQCEARCCYDGAYLSAEDEQRIQAVLSEEAAFFAFLPDPPIVLGQWRDQTPGRKTATQPFDYTSVDFPAHFTRTRCVFAQENGRCSLQVIAVRRGKHPWTYKPTACWAHPLHVSPSGLEPPPVQQAADPDRCEGYPGFSTFTPCGQHRADGRPWREVFAEELEYFDRPS
jgi:hypothetical protein